MLEEAARLAREGEYVLVIATHYTAEPLFDRLAAMEGAEPVGGLKVYFPAREGRRGEVSIVEPGSRFNFRTGRFEGIHPSVRVLIDHFAAEQEIGRVMGWTWREWLRFSAPEYVP